MDLWGLSLTPSPQPATDVQLEAGAGKNRAGLPHPAVPATFSRSAGEALLRSCLTLVRLTGRFALQGIYFAHVYTRSRRR